MGSKNTIKFIRKRPRTLMQREFNKHTGEFDCVMREGGRVIKREPLPSRNDIESQKKTNH